MNDEIDETIDEDMIRMEGLMDEWCLELKRNFLVRNPFLITILQLSKP